MATSDALPTTSKGNFSSTVYSTASSSFFNQLIASSALFQGVNLLFSIKSRILLKKIRQSILHFMLTYTEPFLMTLIIQVAVFL